MTAVLFDVLKDFTKEEDAKLADLCGCARSTVDRWRRGVAIPGPNTIKLITAHANTIKAARNG